MAALTIIGRTLVTLAVRRRQARLLRMAGRGCLLAAAALAALAGLLLSTLAAVVAQHSTLPWPVAVPPGAAEAAQGWRAGGWQVSSGYGWRDDPAQPGRREFHDGLDLSGAPFSLGAALPALLDGRALASGWDRPAAADPGVSGLGLTVRVGGGDPQAGEPELEVLYGHLQPYRLHIRVEGRVGDGGYAPVGAGDLRPAPTLELGCAGDDPPVFVARAAGPGAYLFDYDRPASCSATLRLPARGDGWQGWTAESPTTLSWQTAIADGRASDTALRFRARLSPPPDPAPTPSATPPAPSAATRAASPVVGCAAARPCRWSLADLIPAAGAAWLGQPNSRALLVADVALAEAGVVAPPAATPVGITSPVPDARLTGAEPGDSCPYQGLVPISARAPRPELQPAAAASFEQLRAQVRAATGADPLAQLSDALRAPAYASDKPGVAFRSWHKAGRALDLDTGGPWRVVPEGARFRVFHRPSGLDLTAVLEAAGWRRIPAVGAVAEWWHYEYRPAGLSWEAAMRQVWPLAVLERELPQVAWRRIGCAGDPGDPGDPPDPSAPGSLVEVDGVLVCTPGLPSWQADLEQLPGCGPPVRPGQPLRQLDDRVGFVGLTGQTGGPQLHLAVALRSVTGGLSYTDICRPPFWQASEPPPDGECWTRWADPLDFLPLAQGGPPLAQATAAPAVDQPFQLPPPGVDGALVRRLPGDDARGQYWSPYAGAGRFGGGSIWDWLRSALCRLLPWLDLCS